MVNKLVILAKEEKKHYIWYIEFNISKFIQFKNNRKINTKWEKCTYINKRGVYTKKKYIRKY